jgi:hypothetical protein
VSLSRCAAKAVALATAFGVWASPAAAQNQRALDVGVGLIEPLTITRLSDMDFGDIIGNVAGTIVLSAEDTAVCTPSAGLVHTNVCEAASFGGSGTSNQRVRVRRPTGGSIVLTGPGADMTLDDFTIDGGTTLTPVSSNPAWERFRIATADGTFIFYVGGTLNVNANQAPGVYSGTFTIRLDYQ